MKIYLVVFFIVGFDCLGGVGIQVDIKMIFVLGVYVVLVIIVVIVQNIRGVKVVYIVFVEIVQGQIEVVMEDLCLDVLKIGMVSELVFVKIIVGCLLKYFYCLIVYDFVMVLISGWKLMVKDVIQLIKEEFFLFISLIIFNLDEMEVLIGKKIIIVEEMKEVVW